MDRNAQVFGVQVDDGKLSFRNRISCATRSCKQTHFISTHHECGSADRRRHSFPSAIRRRRAAHHRSASDVRAMHTCGLCAVCRLLADEQLTMLFSVYSAALTWCRRRPSRTVIAILLVTRQRTSTLRRCCRSSPRPCCWRQRRRRSTATPTTADFRRSPKLPPPLHAATLTSTSSWVEMLPPPARSRTSSSRPREAS
jgi:hypothetical protein